MNIKLLIVAFERIPARAGFTETACPIRNIGGMANPSLRKDQVSWVCEDPQDSHIELALLQQAIAERPDDDVRQVYLYSRFAPCPACAQALETFPRLRPAIEFSLAFHMLGSAGSPFIADDVRSGIRKLAESGWRVQDWGSEAPCIPGRSIRTATTARRAARHGDGVRDRRSIPAVLSRGQVTGSEQACGAAASLGRCCFQSSGLCLPGIPCPHQRGARRATQYVAPSGP